MIKYLKYKEIDKTKWDECICNSVNELIYAYSWYLNSVSPNWDALVYEDYEAVMPLTWKKKWGIKYLFQPFVTQQLGVFYVNSANTTSIIINEFFKEFLKKFSYATIYLNYANNDLNIPYKFIARDTQIISLKTDYRELFNLYTQSTVKNIKRSKKSNVVYTSNLNLESFKMLLDEIHPEYYTKSVLKVLFPLFQNLDARGLLFFRGIELQNKLISIAAFIKYRNRIYLPCSITSEEGKNTKSFFALIDYFINEFSETGFVLDFMGSNTEGIKYFNVGFGSQSLVYYLIQYNNLPWYLKMIKK